MSTDWDKQVLKFAVHLCTQLGVCETFCYGVQASQHKDVMIQHQDQYEAIETHYIAAGTFAMLVILHGLVQSGLPLAQFRNATVFTSFTCAEESVRQDRNAAHSLCSVCVLTSAF